jgi:hypothetical protein
VIYYFLAGIIKLVHPTAPYLTGMERKTANIDIRVEPRLVGSAGDSSDAEDVFARMPVLPKPRQRWTVRRKAAVIEAVRGGWVPIEEVCRLYKLSVDEFLAWERDIDRHGIYGLRSTRYQIYRDTDAAWRQ